MSTPSPERPSLTPVLHVVRPDEGVVGPLRVLAGSEQTRTLYFALEWETPPAAPGVASGWHAHEDYDESEYVVTGEREVFVAGHRWQGSSGLFVLVPRRALHTMRTVGAASSTWLHFFSPAGFERFIVERERLRAQGASASEMRALGERYGMFEVPSSADTEPPFASPASARRGGTVVTGEQTRNAYTLAERTALPEKAHAHANQEEAFYVIDGELVLEADGVEVALPARSFVLVPRGVRHRHVTSAGTRLLAVFSPGTAVPH